ncbi:MAG: hypothetical protein U1E76_03755 [Planctomycetota bacterium]
MLGDRLDAADIVIAGAVTDATGHFTLSVPKGSGAVLLASCDGLSSPRVTVTAGAHDIVLELARQH